MAELTGAKAVFRAPELLTQVAIHLLGRASPGQIRQAVEDVKTHDLLSTPTINKSGAEEQLFTTREMLLLERLLLRLAKRPDTRHVLCWAHPRRSGCLRSSPRISVTRLSKWGVLRKTWTGLCR